MISVLILKDHCIPKSAQRARPAVACRISGCTGAPLQGSMEQKSPRSLQLLMMWGECLALGRVGSTASGALAETAALDWVAATLRNSEISYSDFRLSADFPRSQN